MHWYNKPWAPLAAFLILALAGGFALYSVQNSNSGTLYQTQLNGCKRANALRSESNARAVYSQRELTVLRQFLASARDARKAAYTRDHQAADRIAADSYQNQINSLKGIAFNQVPVIDCLKVIIKP